MSMDIILEVRGVKEVEDYDKKLAVFKALDDLDMDKPEELLKELGIKNDDDTPNTDGQLIDLEEKHSSAYKSEGEIEYDGGETVIIDLKKLPKNITKIQVKCYGNY